MDAKNALAGFMDFIRAQGVVGLAIGVVLGAAVGKVVASLVSDIVMPIVAMLLGSTDGIAGLAVMGITYGKFIASLVDFGIIAAVIYFGVKGLGLDKLDKK
jgi:large conductance mechanosensitive channel